MNREVRLTRRQAIKTVTIGTVAAAAAGGAVAQSIIDGRWQPYFNFSPLPYPSDALEPYIDARTMEIHHDKIHAAYVANVNGAMPKVPDFYFASKFKGMTEKSGEDMQKDLNGVPEKIRAAVRNYGGGHYNHSLFWQMMKKDGGGEPKGELADAIAKSFGSFGTFKDQFSKAALRLFGSGWAWLTVDAGALRVETAANEDNPISSGRPAVLGVDVWEHAYYLKYHNKRADYITGWFSVVNWDFVSERYARLKG